MDVPTRQLSQEETSEIINSLITENNVNYNALKVAEECTEVSELMIKTITKRPSHAPKIEDIIEEIGDLLMRLSIYSEHLGIKDRVTERAESKLAYLHKRMGEGALGMEVYVFTKVKEVV